MSELMRECSNMLTLNGSGVVEDSFRCSICLELVYKPVVHSCGHVFCFWCVHLSMNPKGQSQCPVCRKAYTHFPQVCELLHFFLMKAAPEEYNRRAEDIHYLEKSNNVFSPRIVYSPKNVSSPCEEVRQFLATGFSSPSTADMMNLVEEEFPSRRSHKHLIESFQEADVSLMSIGEAEINSPSHGSTSEEDESVYGQEMCDDAPGILRNEDAEEDCDYSFLLTVEDFQCASCSKFLYRPVVLKCGQVFCEPCVRVSGKDSLCPCCPSPHLGISVYVFLELHNYLERAFAKEYLRRKDEVIFQQRSVQSRIEESGGAVGSTQDGMDAHQSIHVGAGCDGCGMFPIVGDRYRCLDCPEKVGYDLCGNCYSNGTRSCTGRFNQQHRPDHCMEKIASVVFDLHMENGLIQRRRQRHLQDDLDDYIDSFV